MTTKQEIYWLVNELNTEGSRVTRNGKNNNITCTYHKYTAQRGGYYEVFMNGERIGCSMTTNECIAALHMLCNVL